MNLPTKLTLSRIIMIPLFVAAYYITAIKGNFYISAGIFALAAVTDFLDGYLARKYNQITDLGKFLDPIADKVLVSTALILLLVPPTGVVLMPWYASIFVAVILARELIVSGFRLVAAGKGKVISADKSGKIKTFFTDISIIVLLVSAEISPVSEMNTINLIGFIMLGVSALLTIVSGAEMLIKNAAVLKEDKKE